MGKLRAGSMATIDEAIQQGSLVQSGDELVSASEPTVSDPHPAPGVYPGTPDKPTPEEKKALDAQKKLDKEEEDKRSARQKLIDEAIAERARQEQENKDAFKKSANTTVDTASKILRGTSVRLEKVPTPGSIMLPLIVLLVFFTLLLPVNGHTRFTWLLLVLTGNADIVASAGGETSSGTNTDTSFLSNFPMAGTTLTGQATVPETPVNKSFLSQFPMATVTPVLNRATLAEEPV